MAAERAGGLAAPPDEIRSTPAQAFDLRFLDVATHIRDDLNLRSQQIEILDAAVEARRQYISRLQALRASMEASLASERQRELMDVERLIRDSDHFNSEMQKVWDAQRDRWLAFWRILNVEQRKILSDAIRARLSRGDAMRDRIQLQQPEQTPVILR